jgi:hypothetical protein
MDDTGNGRREPGSREIYVLNSMARIARTGVTIKDIKTLIFGLPGTYLLVMVLYAMK